MVVEQLCIHNGGVKPLLSLLKLQIPWNTIQTLNEKVHSREGNSPDCLVRSLKIIKFQVFI